MSDVFVQQFNCWTNSLRHLDESWAFRRPLSKKIDFVRLFI
jgi:hypothetical protein